MRPTDRSDEQALELRRFWEALDRGRADPTADLDPALVATVRRLRELHAGSPPADVRDRVWRRLNNDPARRAVAAPATLGSLHVNGGKPMTAAMSATPWAPKPPRRSWPIVPLMAAAALLLAVIFGYRAIRGGDGRPNIIPAAITAPTPMPPTPTATPVPTDQTLLDLVYPAADIPLGEGATGGLTHFTIPPGTRSSWKPYCCPGIIMQYVLEGAYTVRSEDVTRVVRAGGLAEEVAAGNEVVLGPGDTLVTHNETVMEAANTGTVPVELLNNAVIAAGDFGGRALPGWRMGAADVQGPWNLQPVAAPARLRRVILTVGDVIPSPGKTLQFVVGAPGELPSFLANDDGSRTLIGKAGGAVVVYILTVGTTPVEEATPIATPAP